MNDPTVFQSLSVSEAIVRDLAHAFREAHEELYLVGGAIRDRLLGRIDFDLDFATSARPQQTLTILNRMNLGAIYRLGEKFGTIGAKIDGNIVEITTYRTEETYAPNSRKPEVRFGSSLSEDLQRRDFTVNAMAEDLFSGTIIDLFDAQRDLELRLIRAVGDASKRFEEDPLRILRAVRFAAQLDFTIESATWRAMSEVAPQLRTISRERIRDEFSRILTSSAPAIGLTLLRDAGLLEETAPELLTLTHMPDHGPQHRLSLWNHTMRVVSGVDPDLTVRWVAVLHDIGKPATRVDEPDGRPRFFHHEEVAASIAEGLLRGLRYPNELITDIVTLVETHMQLHAYSEEWSDGAIRRLCLRLGPLLIPAFQLARADASGHSATGQSENAPKYDSLERRAAILSLEPVEKRESPLNGDELMARYDLPPGQWIKRVKNTLCDEVIEGRLEPNDRDTAWRIADALMESNSRQNPVEPM